MDYVDPEGRRGELTYTGCCSPQAVSTSCCPFPAWRSTHGFRDIAEALYFRDHVTRQIELADSTDDPEERAA